MIRTTKEQIKNIETLREKGKKQIEIARELGLTTQKINYWFNPEKRKERITKSRRYFLKKTKKQKREYYKSRNEYLKAYNKRRYNEDPIFREKQKARCRKKK